MKMTVITDKGNRVIHENLDCIVIVNPQVVNHISSKGSKKGGIFSGDIVSVTIEEDDKVGKD